jgi:hypothetical protein
VAEAAEVHLTAAACGMRIRWATPTAGRLMRMKNSIGEPAAVGLLDPARGFSHRAGAIPTTRLKK